MPSLLVSKLAVEHKIPVAEVERHWQKAKEIVRKEYKLNEDSEKYWKLVYGVTKKMLGDGGRSKTAEDEDNLLFLVKKQYLLNK